MAKTNIRSFLILLVLSLSLSAPAAAKTPTPAELKAHIKNTEVMLKSLHVWEKRGVPVLETSTGHVVQRNNMFADTVLSAEGAKGIQSVYKAMDANAKPGRKFHGRYDGTTLFAQGLEGRVSAAGRFTGEPTLATKINMEAYYYNNESFGPRKTTVKTSTAADNTFQVTVSPSLRQAPKKGMKEVLSGDLALSNVDLITPAKGGQRSYYRERSGYDGKGPLQLVKTHRRNGKVVRGYVRSVRNR